MIVGLGTGSTAKFAVEMIGQRLRENRLRDILGIPTSSQTARLAEQMGIPLTTLDEHPAIDLTIDGADEVDPQCNLIKGGGGALLYEKIVASASAREVIIVDESKLVAALGPRFPLPVEVIPFATAVCSAALSQLGCTPVLRMAGSEPFRTDEGNVILDCRFTTAITDPAALGCRINCIPGVVENGLFVGLASLVLVASAAGVREMRPQ